MNKRAFVTGGIFAFIGSWFEKFATLVLIEYWWEGWVRRGCMVTTVSTTLGTNRGVLSVCSSPTSSFRVREGTSGSPLAVTSEGTRRTVIAVLGSAPFPILDRRKGRLSCRIHHG